MTQQTAPPNYTTTLNGGYGGVSTTIQYTIPPDQNPYRYSEDTFMKELKEHINGTYSKHYSNEIQTLEYIMSRATTLDGLVMAVFKYIDRYGKKHGWNDEDLFKACHYISMMSHYAKKKFKTKENENG